MTSKTRHSKFFVLLFFMALMVFLTIKTSAADFKIPSKQEGVYVYDTEDSITSKVEEEMEKTLKELEEKTGIEVLIVTYKDIVSNTMKVYVTAEQLLESMKADIIIFTSAKEEKMIIKNIDALEVESIDYVHAYYEKLETSSFSNSLNETVVKTLARQFASEKQIKLEGIYTPRAEKEEGEELTETEKMKNRIWPVVAAIIISMVLLAILNVLIDEIQPTEKKKRRDYRFSRLGFK